MGEGVGRSATLVGVTGLSTRARALWESLAGAPVSFSARPMVVVAPESWFCPPSWVGIVVIGETAAITAPNADIARLVRAAVAPLPVSVLTEVSVLRTVLPVVEAMGPAALSYLDADDFRPAPARHTVEMLRPGAEELRELLASVGAKDANECGLDEITSAAFVVRDGSRLVAAAGFCEWPGAVAHLNVLTATDARGRGLAREVAAAAVSRALDDGLLPQWRARPEPSRRLARTLGFRELGALLSIRVEPP